MGWYVMGSTVLRDIGLSKVMRVEVDKSFFVLDALFDVSLLACDPCSVAYASFLDAPELGCDLRLLGEVLGSATLPIEAVAFQG
jgi:hypothetical protein